MQESGKKEVGIAVAGCGERLRVLCGRLLESEFGGRIRIVSLYDPKKEQAERFRQEILPPDNKLCADDFEELLENPDVDWIFIGSPNSFHYGQSAAAVAAGKDVFLEKPLALSVRESFDLLRLREDYGRRIVTGFVLRYSPLYRTMKQLLEEYHFGPVLTIEANENISYEHAAYITRGWRRKKELAGPHILEKCVHDIDLMQWMGGGRFSRVAATGGRSIFTGEHGGLYSDEILRGWEEKGNLDNADPFALGEVDIEDHVQLLGELDNGVKAQFGAVLGAAIPERRLAVHCLRGSIIGELYSESLRYKTLDMPEEQVRTWTGGGLHGGGDGLLVEQLGKTMVEGVSPPVDLEEGVWAGVTALLAEEARLTGKWLDVAAL